MQGTPKRYYTALNRAHHLAGVDRSYFLVLVALTVPIAFADGFGWMMDMTAGLIFISGYGVGLLMMRADPQMLDLYRRHIRYARYYAALPGIAAKVALPKASVPVPTLKQGWIV